MEDSNYNQMLKSFGQDFLELIQGFHYAVFIGATWLIDTVADWIVNIGLVDDKLIAFFYCNDCICLYCRHFDFPYSDSIW